MKNIILLGILCFFGSKCAYSQGIIAEFLPSSNNLISDLYNIQITNTDSRDVFVSLQVHISQSGKTIYKASTQEKRLSTGVSMLNQFGLVIQTQEYGSNSLDQFISSTGSLPSGKYNGCISISTRSGRSTNICKEMNVELLSPPSLVYPYNKQQLEVKTPVLSWLPPVPSSIQGMNYSLKLVEVLNGQSINEAIIGNPAMLAVEDLPTQSLLYPSTSLALEIDKEYAWQVQAFVDDIPMGKSQVWVFSLSKHKMQIQNRISSQSYFDLNQQENAGELLLIKLLKLKYNESKSRGNLELRLFDSKAQELKIKKSQLKTKSGDNYFNLDLSKIKGIKHEEHYAAVLTDVSGKRIVVNFQYLDADKL